MTCESAVSIPPVLTFHMVKHALSDHTKKHLQGLERDKKLTDAITAYLAEQAKPRNTRKSGHVIAQEFHVPHRITMDHIKKIQDGQVEPYPPKGG
jgi:hypothetical protein